MEFDLNRLDNIIDEHKDKVINVEVLDKFRNNLLATNLIANISIIFLLGAVNRDLSYNFSVKEWWVLLNFVGSLVSIICNNFKSVNKHNIINVTDLFALCMFATGNNLILKSNNLSFTTVDNVIFFNIILGYQYFGRLLLFNNTENKNVKDNMDTLVSSKEAIDDLQKKNVILDEKVDFLIEHHICDNDHDSDDEMVSDDEEDNNNMLDENAENSEDELLDDSDDEDWNGDEDDEEVTCHINEIIDYATCKYTATSLDESADDSSNKAILYKSEILTEDAKCIICMLEYQEGEDIVYLKCKHHSHNNCFKEWAKRKHSCPMCKREVVGDELLDSDSNRSNN